MLTGVEKMLQNLDILASFDLNGRQIRNSFTAAVQLAQHDGVPMQHEHILRMV